jgi:tRNA(adenine34) deaminase
LRTKNGVKVSEHEVWMRRAVQEAIDNSLNGDAPVAAILVQNGRVLAVGHNSKTSSRSGIAHAEMNALLEAREKLGRRPGRAAIYCTLEPCAMCLGAICFAGLKTLVYGAPDRTGGAVEMFLQHPFYSRLMPLVTAGVLEEECEALKKLPSFG